jgi:hypothetical protein
VVLSPEEWPKARAKAEGIMVAAASRVDSILRGLKDHVVTDAYRKYEMMAALFGPLPTTYEEYVLWYEAQPNIDTNADSTDF